MARRHGETLEQSALVVMREMVAAELRQAQAQLRRDLRDDRAHEAESHLEWMHKQVDRLAGLMVMGVRSSSIARRLTFTVLSKAYGNDYAQKVYENAKERAHTELLPKKARIEQVSLDDDDVM